MDNESLILTFSMVITQKLLPLITKYIILQEQPRGAGAPASTKGETESGEIISHLALFAFASQTNWRPRPQQFDI